MQALLFLALALFNIALVIHLGEKVRQYINNWRHYKRLVNDHPEMNSVDPDQGLFVFESDDALRALVLDNDQPGANEPFYVAEEE
ncbi:MAG: hypothetical protein CMN97_11180 [Synechococcus sp. NAT40]|uniref:hypothetical protein n=1 Tax=Synechococcus sp. MIT S9451 TaxID=3082543 RepID=UPI000C9550C2|nr:hypothetical protein [Synechococcus sp. NAT40]RZO11144.1 MAG: hypothetical protein EVB08_09760 [Synechococcus sp. MED-G135]|tara:strand:+ start:180 stop:434 length:255 start_codon:yes stop_codon:yes gene_type:complete